MYANYDMTHKKTVHSKQKIWMFCCRGVVVSDMFRSSISPGRQRFTSLLCLIYIYSHWRYKPLKKCVKIPGSWGIIWVWGYPWEGWCEFLRTQILGALGYWVLVNDRRMGFFINWWLVIWRRYVAPCVQIWAHQALPTSWLLYALDHHRTHLDVSWSRFCSDSSHGLQE